MSYETMRKNMNGRRIEPLSFAWKAKMITTTLTVRNLDFELKIELSCSIYVQVITGFLSLNRIK